MSEGDGESNYAYYCLHNFHITPKYFLNMDRAEKAFVIAAIQRKEELK